MAQDETKPTGLDLSQGIPVDQLARLQNAARSCWRMSYWCDAIALIDGSWRSYAWEDVISMILIAPGFPSVA